MVCRFEQQQNAGAVRVIAECDRTDSKSREDPLQERVLGCMDEKSIVFDIDARNW